MVSSADLGLRTAVHQPQRPGPDRSQSTCMSQLLILNQCPLLQHVNSRQAVPSLNGLRGVEYEGSIAASRIREFQWTGPIRAGLLAMNGGEMA